MPQPHPTQIKLARHLGSIARAARVRASLTQADVAERINIATEVYGRIERGGMLPSLPTFRRLCRALQADANHLLGLDVSPAPRVEVSELPPPEDLEAPISTAEDPPALRRLFRYLKRLTPTQIRAIGQVAMAFLKPYERR